jgi:hypothetical protein
MGAGSALAKADARRDCALPSRAIGHGPFFDRDAGRMVRDGKSGYPDLSDESDRSEITRENRFNTRRR